VFAAKLSMIENKRTSAASKRAGTLATPALRVAWQRTSRKARLHRRSPLRWWRPRTPRENKAPATNLPRLKRAKTKINEIAQWHQRGIADARQIARHGSRGFAAHQHARASIWTAERTSSRMVP